MKVVALVSGGKDSCYNMMLCQQHGHEVVALANLLPEDDSTHELDSFMYQTVGHQLIAAYATCMGLPLFRRRIQGRSKAQGLQYSATEGDEVEDLEVLLSAVKERLPGVQAVSSGAIASDYQRLRVENICSRLGLVSLAYMWRREQSGLLSDMIASGVQAVLVKVAAMGLEPTKHLGQDLRAMRPVLERLKRLYGCNVCGEGGEYESLTLDCPLFKYARIVIDESDVIIHSADAFAPVGILHTSAFHLEYKQAAAHSAFSASKPLVPEGPVTTQPQQDLAGAEIIMVEDGPSLSNSGVETAETGQSKLGQSITELSIGKLGRGTDKTQTEVSGVTVEVGEVDDHGVVRICCDHRTPESLDAAPSVANLITPEVSESAVRSLLTSVEAQLSSWRMTWADVIYVYLFLADMKHFGQANAAYKQVITEEKCVCGGGVPSRSTVQVELPSGCAARVEVLVGVGPGGMETRATEEEEVGTRKEGESAGGNAGSSTGDATDSGRNRNAGVKRGFRDAEPGAPLEGAERHSETDRVGSQSGASTSGAASDGLGNRGGAETYGENPHVNEVGGLSGGTSGRVRTEETAAEVRRTESSGWERGAMEETAAERGLTEGLHGERPRKKVLHVQSISSWAPSCIGPYSQATAYNGRLYMAGQLGLDAASMELVSGGAGTQMARALLSCEAVAQAMDTSARLDGELYTVFYDGHCSEDDLRAVQEELDLFLRGRPSARYTDNFDRASSNKEREAGSSAQCLQLPARRDLREEVAREMLAEESDNEKSEAAVDTNGDAGMRLPEIKYEAVPALPKGALVEVMMTCGV